MSRTRVVIVEDEVIVRRDLVEALRKLGYDVVGAVGSGAAAIDAALTVQPDLILMDIRLKGNMDGIQAAARIREQRDVPIVYLTAYADDPTLQRALETQPYGYLLKPFDDVGLKVTLETTLRRFRIERQSREGHQWMTSLLGSLLVPVIAMDRVGRVTYLNVAAEVFLGQTRHALEGVFLEDVGALEPWSPAASASAPASVSASGDAWTGMITQPPRANPQEMTLRDWLQLIVKHPERQVVSWLANHSRGGAAPQRVLVSMAPLRGPATPPGSGSGLGFGRSDANAGANANAVQGVIVVLQEAPSPVAASTSVSATHAAHATLSLSPGSGGSPSEITTLGIAGNAPPAAPVVKAGGWDEPWNLADMSHEIRSPIQGILGMTDLVLATNLDLEQRQYLALMRETAEHLVTLTSQILDVSRIRAGCRDLSLNYFSLERCVSETLRMLAVQSRAKGLELSCRFEPGLATRVYGDAARFRQILMNLVGNAFKFTPKGEIAVGVTTWSCDAETVQLHITVRDTGIGIAPELQDAVFERHAQAHSQSRLRGQREAGGQRETGGQREGVGLGLSITKTLVEFLGGRIWVESQLGQGSVFHFLLPLGLADPDTPQLPLPGSWRGRVAYVAEPNDTARDILCELLQFSGCAPVPIRTSEDALHALTATHADPAPKPPALWLVNADMVTCSGERLFSALKLHARDRETALPLIVTTTLGESRVFQEVKALDQVILLHKPVFPSELHAVLSQVAAREHRTAGGNRLMPRMTPSAGVSISAAPPAPNAAATAGTTLDAKPYPSADREAGIDTDLDGSSWRTGESRLSDRDRDRDRSAGPSSPSPSPSPDMARFVPGSTGAEAIAGAPAFVPGLFSSSPAAGDWGSAAGSPNQAGQGRRVLLAESRQNSRMITELLLRRQGFAVQIAEQGQRALDMIIGAHFDLIVVELDLPVLDGYQLLQRLRSLDWARARRVMPPVLAMASLPEPVEESSFRNAGFDGCLTKPFRPTDLDRLVNELLFKKTYSD